MELKTNDRLHLWEGNLYLIRDVYKDGSANHAAEPKANGKFPTLEEMGFLRCEYAVLRRGGYWSFIDWHPCGVGVEFKDIEPLVAVSALTGERPIIQFGENG